MRRSDAHSDGVPERPSLSSDLSPAHQHLVRPVMVVHLESVAFVERHRRAVTQNLQRERLSGFESVPLAMLDQGSAQTPSLHLGQNGHPHEVQFIGPISQSKNPDWSLINQDDLLATIRRRNRARSLRPIRRLG